MLETGMRPEEVYRIKPDTVHLADDYLFNPYGKTKAAKRRIKLTATAKSVLARRMDECKDEEGLPGAYLFPHAADPNQPVPKINNAHDRAVRDSKVVPFRLYDPRHTWATRAVEAGVESCHPRSDVGPFKDQHGPSLRSPDAAASDKGNGEDGAVCRAETD